MNSIRKLIDVKDALSIYLWYKEHGIGIRSHFFPCIGWCFLFICFFFPFQENADIAAAGPLLRNISFSIEQPDGDLCNICDKYLGNLGHIL